jgi:hypothetical protein
MTYQQMIDWLTAKSRAYRGLSDEAILDLAVFCRANETCAVPGDRDKTLMLEGRREVFLRIMQHRHLTPDQLFSLYGGTVPKEQ